MALIARGPREQGHLDVTQRDHEMRPAKPEGKGLVSNFMTWAWGDEGR